MEQAALQCEWCDALTLAPHEFCANCGSRVSKNESPASLTGAAFLIESLASAWEAPIHANESVAHTPFGVSLVAKTMTELQMKIARARQDAKPWTVRGNLLLVNGQFHEALSSYEHALAHDGTQVAIWVGKGNALISLHLYERAICAFDMALNIEVGAIIALIHRGYALLCRARYEEALSALGRALDDVRPMLMSMSDADGRRKFSSGLRIAFGYKVKAATLTLLDRYEDALAAYDDALVFEPGEMGAEINRRALLTFLGRETPEDINNTQAGTGVGPSTSPLSKDVSGVGQQVTDPIVLSAGLARFALVHKGHRNFSVWLLDSSGRNVSLLVNQIGPATVSKAVAVPRGGSYLLNVDADGAWGIHIQQP